MLLTVLVLSQPVRGKPLRPRPTGFRGRGPHPLHDRHPGAGPRDRGEPAGGIQGPPRPVTDGLPPPAQVGARPRAAAGSRRDCQGRRRVPGLRLLASRAFRRGLPRSLRPPAVTHSGPVAQNGLHIAGRIATASRLGGLDATALLTKESASNGLFARVGRFVPTHAPPLSRRWKCRCSTNPIGLGAQLSVQVVTCECHDLSCPATPTPTSSASPAGFSLERAEQHRWAGGVELSSERPVLTLQAA